ncbi:ATP-dependent helicase [Ideonella livida]|uniref:DNA 3'-5' helicase n=1 Tax=Ideonella livida TaxID=2707176 RepID=A0A7C9TL80_9BURK|nr:ATP-dependent helicase [Ideonella livida]NDY93018.1 ATP-dependent helicase [Ideonella livida]
MNIQSAACAPRPGALVLNPQQQAAVDHRGGPLLVLAGAGTGKTMTLAARVAALVADGAAPHRLLLLTFSRRAAVEMQQRAGRLLHQALGLPPTAAVPQLPWAGTFHSIGARLLRELAPQLGLDEHFTVLDRADAEDLMAWVRQDLGLDQAGEQGRTRFPLKGTCLAVYSRLVNSALPLDALPALVAEHFPWCVEVVPELGRLMQAYEAAKHAQHLLDYDDLLLYWDMLMADPTLGAQVAARFDQVLVDEYQDTNRLQARLLERLSPQGRGLTVVGDDAQAIYGFRAASVDNILRFARRFEPAAATVALERNYRSTQPILEAANAVMALAADRLPKTLWSDQTSSARPEVVNVDDEAAEARWVADAVLRRREEGLRLKQQAVLFRTGHHSAALELELARRRIPFVKFGGLRFLEAAHVKDALAVLRWAANPRSRLAAFRVVQLLPGMGPARARTLVDALQAASDPWAALRRYESPPAVRLVFEDLRGLMLRLALRPPPWPQELSLVLEWFQPHLERLYEQAVPRALDLQQLAVLARGSRGRDAFLTELALDPPEASSDESGPPLKDEDYLILSTIHSAKGQEWPAVTVLRVVDGCLPADLSTGSPVDLEEERRLLYVAMTRARQHLSLMVPRRFHVTQQSRLGDRHLLAGRSRFLPESLMPLFDHPGPQGLKSAPGTPPPQAVVDLKARLRQRWAAPEAGGPSGSG